MNHNNLKRYQRIGFPEKRVEFDYYLKFDSSRYFGLIPIEKAEMFHSNAIEHCFYTFVNAWLVDEIEIATTWARKAIDSADSYFFGSWRELAPSGNMNELPPDPEYHRQRALWEWQLITSLLMATSLRNWEAVQRYASYPQDNIRLNVDQTEANRAWLLLLCGAIINRPWDEIQKHFDITQKSPKKREKLLARIVHALLLEPDEQLQKACKEYFTYFKTSESKSDSIDHMLPIDGSILYHLANHRGRPLILPATVQDAIIDLPPENNDRTVENPNDLPPSI